MSNVDSRDGLMVLVVRSPGMHGSKVQFPWSIPIAYFKGVKTRFSTLGTGDVPRGSDTM